MKYLVTVGTTSFDSLIEYLDTAVSLKKVDFIFQIANGQYIPKNHPYFRFEDDIFDKYSNRYVISHCGAGTVYFLLESKVRFITVPNLERVDKHQLDLARFVRRNNYGVVSFSFNELATQINSDAVVSVNFERYEKEPFFKGEEIYNILHRDKL